MDERRRKEEEEEEEDPLDRRLSLDRDALQSEVHDLDDDDVEADFTVRVVLPEGEEGHGSGGDGRGPGGGGVPKEPAGFGHRHVFSFFGFLGFFMVYAMRVNLSVCIVAMVNNTAVDPPSPGPGPSNQSDGDTCPYPDVLPTNHTAPSEDGPFDWDANTQGVILGAFFYGYVLTQLPGGRLAETYGGKWVFGVGILVTSIFTLLMPMAAKLDYYLLIATRFIEGLGEGVTFPCMHAMLAQWAPPLERSKLGAYIYAGCQLGTVFSLPISGYLCEILGWESVFYIFGSLGIGWFALWAIFVHDSPAKHPFIGEQEKRYIQESLREANGQGAELQGSLPVPWRSIFRSVPVWAIIVAHIAQNWGFYTLLNELPTYMKQILHFNIRENALLSAIPYLAMYICSILASTAADHCRTKGFMSTTTTRKVFNSIATFIPAALLCMLSYVGCDSVAVMTLITLTGGINGMGSAGVSINHIDIAPNFAGTLLGISNTLANVMGFLSPMVISHIVSGHEDLSHWQFVFFLAAVFYTIGNTFFILFASGEEQGFNRALIDDISPLLQEQTGSLVYDEDINDM